MYLCWYIPETCQSKAKTMLFSELQCNFNADVLMNCIREIMFSVFEIHNAQNKNIV